MPSRNTLSPNPTLTDATLESESDYFLEIQRYFLKTENYRLSKLYNFIQHMELFNELAYERGKSTRSPFRIAHYAGALIIHEWSGVMMSMMSGFHWTAARTLRWIYETAIAVGGACTDGSLLQTTFRSGTPISIAGFRDWLKKYDDPNTHTQLRRSEILSTLGATGEEVRFARSTFSELCKFSHLSSFSFRRIEKDDWFDTVVNSNPPMFKRVYRLCLLTSDVVLYCLLRSFEAMSNRDRNFVGWTDSYRFHTFARNVHPNLRSYIVHLDWTELPMTWRAVNEIANFDPDPIPIKFSWKQYGVVHRIVAKRL